LLKFRKWKKWDVNLVPRSTPTMGTGLRKQKLFIERHKTGKSGSTMALSRYPSPEAKEWWENFQKLLDESNDWPVEYIFKFIAPKEHVGDLKEVFDGHEIDIKASKKGSYHSITSRIHVSSSDEVIDIYQRAGKVEGVISL